MMPKSLTRLSFAAAMLLSMPAFAASPVAGYDSRAQAQNDELRQLQDMSDDDRLARLERLQDATTRYQAQLVQQIQSLQNQLMDVQGQLEEAQYRIRQLQSGVAPQGVAPQAAGVPPQGQNPAAADAAPGAVDTNQPLPENTSPTEIASNAPASTGMGAGFGGTLPTGTPSPAGTPPATVQLPQGAQPAQPMPAGPNELADLDRAFQLVRNKQYDAAVGAYKQFIGAYPNSENTPTAYYWLGQVYFAKRDYDSAQKQFQTVVSRYPDNPKTDEAMLRLAYIYQSKGDNAKAMSTYGDIVKRYPGKPSAQMAGKRLAALKNGG